MNIKAIKNTVALYDSELLRRRNENRRYLLELDTDNLLTHHRHEAGLNAMYHGPDYHKHGGWENPLCQLRGHFLGHWLSAAGMEYAVTGDRELKAKAETIVDELNKCQKRNGGEWCASIPEKYLTFIAQGYMIWAPQYTIHKTFMGLLDLYEFAENEQALEIAVNFSKWFHKWVGAFSEDEFSKIMDVETGGMLEIWAQLYGITKDSIHRELMDRYYRRSLFDGLLESKDVLTNMHANTTIPEVLGAARAYDVTGEQKWIDIAMAYWDCAVTRRGYYSTGGQTCGEVWTPMNSLSPRLGSRNQEHCTVYNMMRLADFLFRHTGDAAYADYWERNLYNGIMAQAYFKNDRGGHGENSGHPNTGLLTYFLPLKSGGVKSWATRTGDFFCCHGTLVQANAGHTDGLYYIGKDTVYVCQYFDTDVKCSVNGASLEIKQRIDPLSGDHHMFGSMTGVQKIGDTAAKYANNPGVLRVRLTISCETKTEFTIKLRKPWWVEGEPQLTVNGKPCKHNVEKGFITINRKWNNDEIIFEFRKSITVNQLPDRPDTVSFLYGPMVLAGLCGHRSLFTDDTTRPEQILVRDNEREWSSWKDTFRTVGQKSDIEFIPLYKVGYEPYSVYFPIDCKGK